jgi:hypothetical protein
VNPKIMFDQLYLQSLPILGAVARVRFGLEVKKCLYTSEEASARQGINNQYDSIFRESLKRPQGSHLSARLAAKLDPWVLLKWYSEVL